MQRQRGRSVISTASRITYLRTTMTQERLSHLMIMHVHKDRTEKLDLKLVLNDFVGESEHCNGIFAKY